MLYDSYQQLIKNVETKRTKTMYLYINPKWQADLDKTISMLPDLEYFSDKRILITGATGLICSAIVDILCRYNDTHGVETQIYVAGRSQSRIENRFQMERPDLFFVPFDASKGGNIFNIHFDYIIHGASNASPNNIVNEPVETMISNFIGMKELLDYAKKHKTKRVLYISSSEVYGKKEHDRPSKEDEYGWIDLLNPRNSYSIGKCAAETLCASYYDEYAVDSVIVRPGHIYGPTALQTDNRVSSAWAYAVARGEDIVMKSDGSQIRSYCYCLDCASAILKVLLNGETVRAYNISNPNSIISIKQMADILAKSAGVNLKMKMPNEEEKKGFNPMSNSSLDSTELLALGWKGLFDAETGFSHTVEVLKEQIAAATN